MVGPSSSELDLADVATDPAPFVEVAGEVHGVASTPHGRVLVTHESDEGVLTTAFDRRDRRTAGLRDAGRGRHRAERRPGDSSARTPRGT